jgi:23S rRNA (guanine745-N1)-methyltransferase
MTLTPLACTVRGCHQPLTRRGNAYACDRGHSFDLSRSGYINLLQPQDRRSRTPGDASAALDARARLLAAGVGRNNLDAVVTQAAALLAGRPDAVVLDLGCGTGEALERVAATTGAGGIGIDISVDAIERGARRVPTLTWVVANADRRLPLLDASVALALSVNARRNAVECARVLAPGDYLLVALPAPDDLIELRALVQGEGVARERAGAVVEEHAALFSLAARQTVRERHSLEGPALRDLLAGTYRGARRSQQGHIGLDMLDVTLAADLLIFRRR